MFRLLNEKGEEYLSPTRGLLGGHRGTKRYGRMDCPAARRALSSSTWETYKKHRVFFADEATAISAGFQPCGTCMREEYKRWKAAGDSN